MSQTITEVVIHYKLRMCWKQKTIKYQGCCSSLLMQWEINWHEVSCESMLSPQGENRIKHPSGASNFFWAEPLDYIAGCLGYYMTYKYKKIFFTIITTDFLT